MSKITAVPLLFALTLVLVIPIFSDFSAQAVNPKVYNLSDSYQKTAPQGKEVTFSWELSNPDPILNYSVDIDVHGDEGWELDFSDYELSLSGSDFKKNKTVFTLTVDTSNRPFGDTGDFTVIFNFIPDNESGKEFEREKFCSILVESLIATAGIDILGFHLDLPERWDTPWVRFGISVVTYILIGMILYFILIPFVRRLTRFTSTDLDDQIIEIIKRPVFVVIVSYAIVASLSRLELPDRFIYFILMSYKVVLVFMLAWAISKISGMVIRALGGLYAKKTSKEVLHKTLTPVLQKTLSFIIYFISLMVVFDQLGIYVTPFLASIGVIGLVIAFAAQETLSNLFSGIMILADRPYKVGDILQFDEGYYEVQHIGFRSTTVRNIFRNYAVNYPNRVLEKNKIINEFEPDRRYFLFRYMTLDYDTDIFRALEIIRQAAYDHSSVIKNDKRHSDPSARIKEFTDLGVRVYLWCYIYDWWDQWLANDEILQEIIRRYKKEGIKLAYPTRVLQFDSRSTLSVSETGDEGIHGMTFEGIDAVPHTVKGAGPVEGEKAGKYQKKIGMAGMKKRVEKGQAKLLGKKEK